MGNVKIENDRIQLDGVTGAPMTGSEAWELVLELVTAVQGTLHGDLVVVDGETDNADHQRGLRCPHCQYLHGDDATLIEVDWSYRWNYSTPDLDDQEIDVNQGESEFETVAYRCEPCGAFVDRPDGWDSNWG